MTPELRELLTEARNVIENEAQAMFDSHTTNNGQWDDASEAKAEFDSWGELVRRIDAALDAHRSATLPPQKPSHESPCPEGDNCPDARRYGAIHPAPSHAAPTMDVAVRDAWRSALALAACICEGMVYDRENPFDNGCWSCADSIRQELNAILGDISGQWIKEWQALRAGASAAPSSERPTIAPQIDSRPQPLTRDQVTDIDRYFYDWLVRHNNRAEYFTREQFDKIAALTDTVFWCLSRIEAAQQSAKGPTPCAHTWTRPEPQPPKFTCSCGTVVYRSYEDAVDD